jgi:hypothetical protein
VKEGTIPPPVAGNVSIPILPSLLRGQMHSGIKGDSG